MFLSELRQTFVQCCVAIVPPVAADPARVIDRTMNYRSPIAIGKEHEVLLITDVENQP